MRATVLGMFGVLLILLSIAAWQGTGVLKAGFVLSWRQLFNFLPILVMAMLLAGFTETLLPKQFVEHWLQDSSGWQGITIAWAAGIITPGGSIVGLPIIASLYKSGIGTAVLMTYATSLATLSILRIPLETGFYGWRLTALRFGVSLILPFIAGGLTLIVTNLMKQG